MLYHELLVFHMFYDIEKARTEVSRTSFVYSLKRHLSVAFWSYNISAYASAAVMIDMV